MLEFVTFHVELGAVAPVHPNKTMKHAEYMSMIDMMFASARFFHPEAIFTVLTDQTTRFKSLWNPGHLVRNSMDARKLMLERTQSQLKYIVSNDFKRPIVVLDSDILINRSLLPVITDDFDVALTWRASKRMPINGGFLILNNARPTVTKNFFERYASIYQSKYLDKADWFGDQLALSDCVGLRFPDYASKIIVDSDGCRILLLPCDTYNFSPENQFSEIVTPLLDKFVLHFKGERKRLMNPFWTAWLKPGQTRSPWAQMAGWHERRWLRREAALETTGPAEVEEENF